MDMQPYYQQHRELIELATRLQGTLPQSSGEPEKAKQAFDALLALAAKLNTHLAAEDKFLYPKLKASGDEAARSTASTLETQMGGIKAAFGDYRKRWGTAAAINKDAAGFARETRGIVNALAQRIELENKDLYPMASRAV